MVYTAKVDIGDYKKGDVVPDEIAQVWEKMYKVSPVKKGKGNSKNDSKTEEVKEESKGIVDSIKGKFSDDKKSKN